MTHLLILFFATFSAALMGVVFPGLVNITTAKTSAIRGKQSGVIFAAGASTTVILQAYIGVLISKYLYNNPAVIDGLLKAALLVFAFFAIYFLVLARRDKTEKKVRVVEITKKNLFARGAAISALNVLPIAYFCGLNAAWNVSGWIKFKWQDILTFILAAGLGTFAMLYMYVFYFDKLQEKTDTFSKYSDYILSALMLILLIITLIRIFYTGT